jgi:SulP family sulfate permease
MNERVSEPRRMAQDREKRPLELKDFKLFRQFSDEELSSIKSCVAEVCVKKGQKIFSAGDSGEEMFLVRRGGVRIMLPLQDGK